jgi:hypothetical protein
MRWGAIAVGLATLVAATPAAARPIYFHKPNVDRDTYAADFGHCDELAGGVRKPAPLVTYSPNMAALAINSLFNGFYQSKQKRRMINNVVRTCMADKGYRRVEASEALVKELDKLKDEQRLDRLFAAVGAPEPMGEVLPQ